MLLRSQLMARLPVTARLCKITSVSYLSSASIVLSRCHSHTIATSTPQLARHFGASLVWVRGNRKDFDEANEVKGARTKHTDDSDRGDGGKEPPVKNLLLLLCSSVAVGIIAMWNMQLMRKNPVPDGVIPAGTPRVNFTTFAKKYLRAGEVQKIVFIMHNETAVATLHTGAVIDGKPAESDHVIINYPNRAPYQFESDVRKEEAEMGISSGQGVPIERLLLVPMWQHVVFFVTFAYFFAMMIWSGKRMLQTWKKL